MELEYRQLSGDEIQEGLKSVKGWQVVGNALTKEFRFDSYMDGVRFAVSMAEAADRMDHHPDIEIGYQKVSVGVSTHSVGGLSPYDFELARRIDELS